jgi:hypothetical protein
MRNKLLNRTALLIFIIFGVNVIAGKFYWYSTIWWFDMPMHFLGGIWLGLASVWVYFFRRKGDMPRITVSKIVRIALVTSLVVGFGWELYEYAVQMIIPGAEIASPLDSLSDLFFDTAGGLVAALYIVSHISFTEKEQSTI